MTDNLARWIERLKPHVGEITEPSPGEVVLDCRLIRQTQIRELPESIRVLSFINVGAQSSHHFHMVLPGLRDDLIVRVGGAPELAKLRLESAGPVPSLELSALADQEVSLEGLRAGGVVLTGGDWGLGSAGVNHLSMIDSKARANRRFTVPRLSLRGSVQFSGEFVAEECQVYGPAVIALDPSLFITRLVEGEGRPLSVAINGGSISVSEIPDGTTLSMGLGAVSNVNQTGKPVRDLAVFGGGRLYTVSTLLAPRFLGVSDTAIELFLDRRAQCWEASGVVALRLNDRCIASSGSHER